MNKFETVDVAELSAVVGGKKKKKYNQRAAWKCGVGAAVGGLAGGILGAGNPIAVAGGVFSGYAKYCA